MAVQIQSLTPEQIEIINSYGPYNHSVWSAPGVEITNEEQLSGRGEALVRLIRASIVKYFSMDEIQKASIVDIGCYDGWILHRLSDLPFARMVGVEPRQKNILKGQKIREILHIPCRVEFQQGDLHTLAGETFDVVLCTGVLHHLGSILEALGKIRAVCKRLLFIETICLSSHHITTSLRTEIEMKDIIYRYKKNLCGLTCQKYESTAYDGSASGNTIVSIPSLETLEMSLKYNRFDSIDILVSPENYRAAVLSKNYHRSAKAVCLTALAVERAQDDALNCIDMIHDYESGLMRTVLDRRLVGALYQSICLNQKPESPGWLARLILAYLRVPSFCRKWVARFLQRRISSKIEWEIIRNLIYNPVDKICLEYAKVLFLDRRYPEAIDVLSSVVQKLNADWRAAFRSMFLLSRIYALMGQDVVSQKYRNLCLISCENYPIDRLQDFSPNGKSV